MTTTVTIKHEGPDHHDIQITAINPKKGLDSQEPYARRLASGESTTLSLYEIRSLIISEVAKIDLEIPPATTPITE
jgi:hypothetical protein